MNLDDYKNAPSGIGPLASEWKNKPHRLVYDLVGEVRRSQAQVLALRQAMSDARRMLDADYVLAKLETDNG